jgi:archaellum component FlaC
MKRRGTKKKHSLRKEEEFIMMKVEAIDIEKMKEMKNDVRAEIQRIDKEIEKLKNEVDLLRSAEDNICNILNSVTSLEFNLAEIEFMES